MTDEKPHWLVKIGVEAVVLGLVAPLAVGLALYIFGPRIVETWLTPPTCESPGSLNLLDTSKTPASSPEDDHRFEDDGLIHPASDAVDGNTGTAWVEKADGPGKGVSITFELPSDTDLQLVCIVNGYASSWEAYSKNARARQLRVDSDAGERVSSLADKTAQDFAEFQELLIVKGHTDSLILTIESVRSSAGTQAVDDTSISEVEFWASDRRVARRWGHGIRVDGTVEEHPWSRAGWKWRPSR